MAPSRAAPKSCRLLLFTFALVALLNASLSSANGKCGVTFLFPAAHQTLHYRDVVNVTYQSNFSNPTLYTWCGGDFNSVTQKAIVSVAPPFNASVNVELNFNSGDYTCWFDLRPNTPDCGDNSADFKILNEEGSHVTVGLNQPSPSSTTTSSSGRATKTAAMTASAETGSGTSGSGSSNGNPGLSTGAQIGLGIGLSILVGLLAGGLAVFLWLRRQQKRKNAQDLHTAILAHDFHPGGGPGGVGGRRDEKPETLLDRHQQYDPHHQQYGGHSPQQQYAPDTHSQWSGHTGANTSYNSAPTLAGLDAPRNVFNDAYYVGSSENLPGFYGSARESGSKHDVNFPGTIANASGQGYNHRPTLALAVPPSVSAFDEGYQSLYQGSPAPSSRAATPAQYYPPEKGGAALRAGAPVQQQQERHEPSAELPGGKDSYRGYGQEYELSAQHPVQPFNPASRDAQEQKFLLEDMELLGLKKQKMKDRDPG